MLATAGRDTALSLNTKKSLLSKPAGQGTAMGVFGNVLLGGCAGQRLYQAACVTCLGPGVQVVFV